MRRTEAKKKPTTLGAVANIAVLERQLGQLEYRIAKLDAILHASALPRAELSRLREEHEALVSQRPQLIKLLDQENARLAADPNARP